MKIFKRAYIQKLRFISREKGMTIAEVIVVLSIFAILATVVMFNYSSFLSRIDIKVLANDIALKLVDAQKSATSGKQNSLASSVWKPSYGVYFDLAVTANTGKKVFYSFVDLSSDGRYDRLYDCPGTHECLERINITKNNYISELRVAYQQGTEDIADDVVQNLHLTFTRPDYEATIGTSTALKPYPISYVQITVSSADGSITSSIRLYTSGRIQIN